MKTKLLNISKQLLIVKTPEELNILLNELIETLNLSWTDYQKGIDTFSAFELNALENELNRYDSAEQIIVYIFYSSITTLNEYSFKQKNDPFNAENKVMIYASIYILKSIVKWLDVNFNVKDFNIYYEIS